MAAADKLLLQQKRWTLEGIHSGGPLARKASVPLLAMRLAGELAVIVLGVAIALWVDGAAQSRSEAEREQAMLADLGSELAGAQQMLVSDIAYNSCLFDNRESIVEAYELGRPPGGVPCGPQELGRRGYRNVDGSAFDPADGATITSHSRALMTFGHSYDPRVGVLRSLISTGDMSLVRNTALRADLAAWLDGVDEIRMIYGYMSDVHSGGLVPTLASLEPSERLTDSSVVYYLEVQNLFMNGWVARASQLKAQLDAIVDLIGS